MSIRTAVMSPVEMRMMQEDQSDHQQSGGLLQRLGHHGLNRHYRPSACKHLSLRGASHVSSGTAVISPVEMRLPMPGHQPDRQQPGQVVGYYDALATMG
ncbi:MAG: hypothetical protein KAG66_08235 [Methylococcales bacterium]|nr:hypothetical protein [Methylococcales bacterium]